MKSRRRWAPPNIHESFSDVALLMLATFIFLLVTILITSRMAEEYELPKLKKEVEELRQQLARSNSDKNRLLGELDNMADMSTDAQMDRALDAVGLGRGQGGILQGGEDQVQGVGDVVGEEQRAFPAGDLQAGHEYRKAD